MGKRVPSPPLLPIFRSQHQGEVLAWILDDPEREISESDLARRLKLPQPTVNRIVRQATQAGVVRARRVGRTKVVSAERSSVYFAPLRELMVRSFGLPYRLAAALSSIPSIDAAYIFGSWAARHAGVTGNRPVGDVDLLVLGTPDKEELYRALETVREAVGYEIQTTIRPPGWIEKGSASFHDTVVARPLLKIDLDGAHPMIDSATSTASELQTRSTASS